MDGDVQHGTALTHGRLDRALDTVAVRAPVGLDDGVALLWHHVDSSGWGATFSMSLVRNAPGARFSMDSDSANMPGAMLWFGPDYKLLRWRKGMMRDLTAGFRRRPADLDQQDRNTQ